MLFQFSLTAAVIFVNAYIWRLYSNPDRRSRLLSFILLVLILLLLLFPLRHYMGTSFKMQLAVSALVVLLTTALLVSEFIILGLPKLVKALSLKATVFPARVYSVFFNIVTAGITISQMIIIWKGIE